MPISDRIYALWPLRFMWLVAAVETELPMVCAVWTVTFRPARYCDRLFFYYSFDYISISGANANSSFAMEGCVALRDSYVARRWAEHLFGLAVGVHSNNANTVAWVVVVRLWIYSGFGETIYYFYSNHLGVCMAAMMLMFVRLYVSACVHMRSCVHYQLFDPSTITTTIHKFLLVHYILLVAEVFTAGECMFASFIEWNLDDIYDAAILVCSDLSIAGNHQLLLHKPTWSAMLVTRVLYYQS
jgi:hypothetical protein